MANAPMNLLETHAKRIAEVTVLQALESYGAMITAWEGPMFTSGDGKTLPVLSKFNLSDDGGVRDAKSIIEDLPAKALDMIRQGVTLLNNEGLEDEWAQGNSLGR